MPENHLTQHTLKAKQSCVTLCLKAGFAPYSHTIGFLDCICHIS